MNWEAFQANAEDAIRQTATAQPAVWITISILLLVGYVCFRAASEAVGHLLFRRLGGKKHSLTVITSEDTRRDTIWLNRKTIGKLRLIVGDTIRIKGTGPQSRGNDQPVLISYRLKDLDDWQVEISAELQRLLFNVPPADGVNPIRSFAFSPKVPKGGFQEFWFNPNEQLRFQNRLSIYLALGLPMVQVVWSWAQT